MVMVICPRLVFSAYLVFSSRLSTVMDHAELIILSRNSIIISKRLVKMLIFMVDFSTMLTQCSSLFTSMSANPQQRIEANISQRSQERVRKNRAILFFTLNLLVDRVWPFGVIVIILLVMMIRKATFTPSFALLWHQVISFLNSIWKVVPGMPSIFQTLHRISCSCVWVMS